MLGSTQTEIRQEPIGDSYALKKDHYRFCFLVCEEGPGICAHLLTAISLLIIAVSLPLSLFVVIKVVQV